MTTSLTLDDRVLLISLMALNDELTNRLLKEHVGLKVTKQMRERLTEAGLLTATMRRPAYWYELSEQGWAWCREEMARPAPAGSRPGVRALYAVLAGLHRYLGAADLRPSDIFDAAPRTLEERIRDAYAQLDDGSADWLPLSRIRALLAGVPKEDIDRVLLDLESQPDVHLVPETDQRRLDASERAAAVRVGGKDQHLLRIG